MHEGIVEVTDVTMYATGVMHEGDIEHGRVIYTAHRRRSLSTDLLQPVHFTFLLACWAERCTF
jgi:hypothetical protein